MGYRRDYGDCCGCIPLKFGAGLISMLTFISSIVCLLALCTGDVRFQANGYDQRFFNVPSIVGSFGLVFGFVGLLGVYDDKIRWVKAFTLFLFVRLVAQLITALADNLALRGCGDFMATAHPQLSNPLMYAIAHQGLCSFARIAYLLGSIIDVAIHAQFYYSMRCFQQQLEVNPTFSIDFGRQDEYDAPSRWRLYKAKAPSKRPAPVSWADAMGEEDDSASTLAFYRGFYGNQDYGSATQTQLASKSGGGQGFYGADGMKPHFTPDGMAIQEDDGDWCGAGGGHGVQHGSRSEQEPLLPASAFRPAASAETYDPRRQETQGPGDTRIGMGWGLRLPV